MTMLTLNDLDFENTDNTLAENLRDRSLQEAIVEIRETRAVLGKFTLRDSMEAVYGTAYTINVLGEEGGKDILVEELSAIDDLLEANGKDRRDVGGNRLPTTRLNKLDEHQQRDLRDALHDQEGVIDEAVGESLVKWAKDDAKALAAQKVVEDITNMLPEDRAEIIRLLQEQAKSG